MWRHPSLILLAIAIAAGTVAAQIPPPAPQPATSQTEPAPAPAPAAGAPQPPATTSSPSQPSPAVTIPLAPPPPPPVSPPAESAPTEPAVKIETAPPLASDTAVTIDAPSPPPKPKPAKARPKPKLAPVKTPDDELEEPSATAASRKPPSFRCFVRDVMAFYDRTHVRCYNKARGKFVFFAVDTSQPISATVLSKALNGMQLGKPVTIAYAPGSDLNPSNCDAKNCRRLLDIKN